MSTFVIELLSSTCYFSYVFSLLASTSLLLCLYITFFDIFFPSTCLFSLPLRFSCLFVHRFPASYLSSSFQDSLPPATFHFFVIRFPASYLSSSFQDSVPPLQTFHFFVIRFPASYLSPSLNFFQDSLPPATSEDRDGLERFLVDPVVVCHVIASKRFPRSIPTTEIALCRLRSIAEPVLLSGFALTPAKKRKK
jgi:hypothetical protein